MSSPAPVPSATRHRIVTAALLVGASGLLVGALALAAPAGVWLGIWDFRRGFDLLRLANTHARWWGIVSLLATVGGLILAGRWQARPGVGLRGLAVVGVLATALAYFYPQSFAAPAGSSYPPIHDISTDTQDPPHFVAVLPLRANAANSAIYGDSPRLNPTILARLTREAYPDVVTWRTDESADAIFDRALAAVDALGWELVDANREEGRIEATATTLWFRFKDDIVVRIVRNDTETVVDARSVSRVGTGDVGANAKRLRAFFALLRN